MSEPDGGSSGAMRLRLLSTRGSGQHWHEDAHAETLLWAQRLAHYGVRWREIMLPIYVDTLNADPIFRQIFSPEPAVVLEDFALSLLAECASDWNVTFTLVPTERWIWAEDGNPITHSLVLNDDE